MSVKKKRVIVYVDWYNLYHSVNEQFWHKWYYRVDYRKLFEGYLNEWEQLIWVTYFTAYCERNEEKKKRHKKLVTVLRNQNIRVVLWIFYKIRRKYTKRSNKIRHIVYSAWVEKFIWRNKRSTIPEEIEYRTYEEKATDVNMALRIYADWIQKKYDRAIVVSWDSDFLPAIKFVKNVRKDVVFDSLLLAKTKGKAIRKLCDNNLVLSEKDIIKCILPSSVTLKSWKIIKKPKMRSNKHTTV